MATRFRSTSRGLLLAGALAFLALPAFAQSAPATQPAAASTSVTTSGKQATTDAGKTVGKDGKKTAGKTSKSKTHKVMAKKGTDKFQKPATAPAADSAKKS